MGSTEMSVETAQAAAKAMINAAPVRGTVTVTYDDQNFSIVVLANGFWTAYPKKRRLDFGHGRCATMEEAIAAAFAHAERIVAP